MADIEFDEESSGSIVVEFEDRDGDDVIPTSIKWTLTTTDGVTIINEREQEDVETPAASIEILLSGDDLALLTAEVSDRTVARKLTIEAVYDSDLGDDLPLNSEKSFSVRNLAYIT